MNLTKTDSQGLTTRPTHQTSRNLTENEHDCLFKLFEPDTVTLATAVAQILYGTNGAWRKHACGALCFVKDYTRRSYSFRLYNLQLKTILYEETVSVPLKLEKYCDIFYTFDGEKCRVGINFVDLNEANKFSGLVNGTQSQRQIRARQQSANATIKTPIVNDKKRKEILKKKHLVISKPVENSFEHIMKVSQDKSFVNDQSKQQLFEDVLQSLKISPEEKTYLRQTANTTVGLAKLFQPNNENISPEINLPRLPHQDISLPIAIYHQMPINRSYLQDTSNIPTTTIVKKPIPPPVAPKPTHLQTNSTQHSGKTSRAPPPPPPPLPPSLPTNFLEHFQSPIAEHSDLHNEIINFQKAKLKPVAEQTIDENVIQSQTLEENIRMLLINRRIDIMGHRDEENIIADDDDDDDDEWAL